LCCTQCHFDIEAFEGMPGALLDARRQRESSSPERINLGIWRRPDTIAKIGKAEARGARFGHIALWLIAAIGLMILLRRA
jgi:hypothetical protein